MQHQILFRIILFFSLLYPSSSSYFSQTPPKGFYAFVYAKYGIIGSVEFNGMTIIPESQKEDISGQIDLNAWIQPGENRILIKGIRKIKADDPSPKIKVNLYLAQEGQFPDEGEKISNYEWSGEEAEAISLPFEKEILFTPVLLPPSTLWNSAEKIDLNDSEKENIQNLVGEFFSAFQKKEEAKLFDLMKFKISDFTTSRFGNKEEGLSDLKKGIKQLLKTFGGKLHPVVLTKLQFKLIANGKAVEVTENGKSPIRAAKDGSGFSIPIYVSKIQGKWILSR